MTSCSVPNCDQPHKGHGFCNKHRVRFRLYGDPLVTKQVPPDLSPVDRLLFYGWTVTDTGCWEYLGCRTQQGYAKVPAWKQDRTTVGARIAYEAWVGQIPDGAVIRHKCDNPPCINPEHLEPGTYKDNSQDMTSRGRWRGGKTKITAEQAGIIRRRADTGESFRVLGLEFGISECAVRDIHRRRTWTGLHATLGDNA